MTKVEFEISSLVNLAQLDNSDGVSVHIGILNSSGYVVASRYAAVGVYKPNMTLVMAGDKFSLDYGANYTYNLSTVLYGDFYYNFTMPPEPSSGSGVELHSGQTSCWDASGTPRSCSGTGEDGDVDGTAKAFVNNGDGTVSDPQSGLMWEYNDSVSTLSWQAALDYCNNGALCTDGTFQSTGSCSEHGSVLYNDWHLPTVVEIITMIDYGYPGSSFRNSAFTWNSYYYWSSTSHPSWPYYAYLAGMNYGYINYDDKSLDLDYVARCVRPEN